MRHVSDFCLPAISLVIPVSLLILGCATRTPEPQLAQQGQDYELSWSPNDENGTFGIKLTSKSKTSLCFSVDDWPDRLGEVSGGAGRASLKAVHYAAPSADTNFGFCVGRACTIVVAPYATVEGIIGYKEFGDPGAIKALRNKQLTYNISPFFCPT
jgi:hypothetical protein